MLDIFYICQLTQGLHNQAFEDCENALELNVNNYRALYRKARCLKEMGKCQEAYDVIAKCSLVVPQVSSKALLLC